MASSLQSFFKKSATVYGKTKPLLSIPKIKVTSTPKTDEEGSSSDRETSPIVATKDDTKPSTTQKSEKSSGKKAKKPKKPKTEENSEEATEKAPPSCTAFIGNVSLEATPQSLKKFITSTVPGVKVVSVRFRSVPISGCAVDKAGNQKLVRKVCTITKQFAEGRETCNAYAVFASPEDVEKAFALSGVEFNGKKLRVDYETNKADSKLSLFLGNLSYDVSEQTIKEHFLNLMGNSEADAVTNVRIIRDAETGRGKGFGYAAFKDLATVSKILPFNGTKIDNRAVRISVCGKRFRGGADKANSDKKRTLSGAAGRMQLKEAKGGKPSAPPAKKARHQGGNNAKPIGNHTHSKKKPAFKKEKTAKKPSSARKEKPKKPKHMARKALKLQQSLIESNQKANK